MAAFLRVHIKIGGEYVIIGGEYAAHLTRGEEGVA